MRKSIVPKRVVLALLSVVLTLVFAGAGAAAASASSTPTTTYGPAAPTFVGPAATGCATGCSLLSGPVTTASTAGSSSASKAAATASTESALSGPLAMPMPTPRALSAGALHTAASPTPVIPTVRCAPIGDGCDTISSSAGGAVGAKGINAVDSGSLSTNPLGDLEPPDQGLCAGNGYVVQDNNIGEMRVYDTSLNRESGAISLDTVMGLTSRGWSSGGDTSCEYDASNGGHWFFTEIVSSTPESGGGTFAGCFAAAANTCYEGIAVSQGSSPFGPYYVYYLNANYNPQEAGYPYLLNDFAKIGVTRDAFLIFYDEFPLNGSAPGVGGGFFNGAQEFAFDKTAMETGRAVTQPNGHPNRDFNVAIENMGQLATPDGSCAGSAGVDCWAAVIPAQPADSGQFDNSHGGSGFMMDSLDFNSFAGAPTGGDNRIAVWDWTGLAALDSSGCSSCSSVQFGGDLFTGTDPYYDPSGAALPSGLITPQKAGPIPLGDECGAAGLSVASGNKKAPKSCPEGGLATNGDFMTQVSQAQGQLWGGVTTQVNQEFASSSELHQGAVYFVVDTSSFDTTGQFTLTNQGYVSAAHEELEFPAMAGEGTGGNGQAIMAFTLNGNGGPSHADGGGFYPSTAYGRLNSASNGLTGSTINIADLGQSPQDGFSEYQGYPGTTRPRWGDYGEAIYLPGGSDRLYFSNEYIQYPNCTGKSFTLTIGTCGGTRDGFANWGTSVNYVVP